MQYVKSPMENVRNVWNANIIIYTLYYNSIVSIFSTGALRARRKPKGEAFTLPLLFQAPNYVQLQQVTGSVPDFLS